MEAKKQSAGEEDLSMEEILQSIRRIIADDAGEEKPKAADASVTNGVGESPAIASDILELTDMIEDDGSITNLKEAQKTPEKAVDVLDNIDAALSPKETAPPVEVKVETSTPEAEKPAPVKAEPIISAPEPKKEEKISDSELEQLLSKTAEEAAVSSLSKLKIPDEKPMPPTTPSPEFRSGSTVEDLVEELLKPMMKDWLDKNLPTIVERIVEREVIRLTRR
jgi:cell pole-organizing protein PopZ